MAKLSPSDVQYQLEHLQDNKIPELLLSQIICFILAITAVILRLVSRRLQRASILSDDYMILIALAFLTAYFIVSIVAIHNGSGRHVVLLQHPALYIKLVFIISILYLVGNAALKISILLLYSRIFGVNQHFKPFSWALGAFIFAYNFSGIFVVIFQCEPVHGLWDTTIKATCINFTLAAVILTSLDAATDILTFALPMPFIWQLRMSRGRKFQITGIFLLGGLVCIVGIYRASIQHQMSQPDMTWSQAGPGEWAMLELGIGIVSACLPTLRPVLHWITHGSTYEFRASKDHLQKTPSSNKPKRGPLSWLIPTSLQLSTPETENPLQKEPNKTDERV